jgi:hypothetical protein
MMRFFGPLSHCLNTLAVASGGLISPFAPLLPDEGRQITGI